MVIAECIDRLEEYGYVVSISPWPGRLYIDGYGLRIGLTVNEGIVTEIDCYLRREVLSEFVHEYYEFFRVIVRVFET